MRFGSSVEHKTQFTRNGILLPENFLEGPAAELVVWIPREVFTENQLGEDTVRYSLATVFEPRYAEKWGLDFGETYTGIK